MHIDHTTQRRFYFPGSEEFRVRDHFAVGFDPVHIAYLGENFRHALLDLVVPPEPAGFFSTRNLTERLTGPQIVERFGSSCHVTLPVVWHLLREHESGLPGALLTTGQTNILIHPGVDYTIGIFWFRGGWSIRAYPFQSEKQRAWFAGNQVLVRSV
jgi:hypothetical protein